MFGKSASAITEYLLTTEKLYNQTCTSFLQKSLKDKTDTIIESIEGYQITNLQKNRMIMVGSHLELVEKSIKELNTQLDQMVKSYDKEIDLLCTVPGMNHTSAITILSEVGSQCLNLPLLNVYVVGWV